MTEFGIRKSVENVCTTVVGNIRIGSFCAVLINATIVENHCMTQTETINHYFNSLVQCSINHEEARR